MTAPVPPVDLDQLETARRCSIEGCGGPHRARGMCHTHWQKAKRRGDFIPDLVRYASPHELLQAHGVMAESGCWEWTAKLNFAGYGSTKWADVDWFTHRLSFETYVGSIPEGLTLDHLCRNPACMRPDHLEPVTSRENTLRGTAPTAINARKTHCHRGHEFTPENTKRVTTKYGHPGRACRACARAYDKRRRAGARSA